jgi:hypothetical protein
MNGYETFEIFQSLKLHFTTEKYDYFKYGGKTNVSVSTFENRKDKYHFYKLSRKFNSKEDLESFLVANFVEDDVKWVGDLLLEEAKNTHLARQRVLQSLSYNFENDCKVILEDCKEKPEDCKVIFNRMLKVNDGNYPPLLTLALRKEIQIETVIILNKILGFVPNWSKQITDSIRWPDYQRKINKYASFLPQDVVKYTLILKKMMNND